MTSKKIIHIGFPKTGSTYLQHYFSAHPELNHDRERFEYYVKTGVVDENITPCHPSFAFDVLSEELLSIWPGDDAGLDYKRYNLNYDIKLKQKETAESLKNLFPEAKVLIGVRGYQSLVSSLYSQYLLGGGTQSFKKVLRTQQLLTLEMYDYDYTISLYCGLFGENNVLVMPFEFLSDNPLLYLEHVEQFFGFRHFQFPSQRIHASVNSHSAYLVRGINFLVLAYLHIVPKPKRKQKLLNYLEWLDSYKEKLNRNLKFGKKLVADVAELRVEEFKQNSKLVRFKDDLKKYDSYYE